MIGTGPENVAVAPANAEQQVKEAAALASAGKSKWLALKTCWDY